MLIFNLLSIISKNYLEVAIFHNENKSDNKKFCVWSFKPFSFQVYGNYIVVLKCDGGKQESKMTFMSDLSLYDGQV